MSPRPPPPPAPRALVLTESPPSAAASLLPRTQPPSRFAAGESHAVPCSRRHLMIFSLIVSQRSPARFVDQLSPPRSQAGCAGPVDSHLSHPKSPSSPWLEAQALAEAAAGSGRSHHLPSTSLTYRGRHAGPGWWKGHKLPLGCSFARCHAAHHTTIPLTIGSSRHYNLQVNYIREPLLNTGETVNRSVPPFVGATTALLSR